jgi:hypothetical protein
MEMKEIIKAIHGQWMLAKDEFQARYEAAHMMDYEQRTSAFKRFNGTEDFKELAALFTSTQGLLFCTENNFPNLATFRLFRSIHPEQYGIYIDAGEITLNNPENAILIGRTNATILCDDNTRHYVVTMHGASAIVIASKWAVVRAISAVGTSIVRRTKEYAIIL